MNPMQKAVAIAKLALSAAAPVKPSAAPVPIQPTVGATMQAMNSLEESMPTSEWMKVRAAQVAQRGKR